MATPTRTPIELLELLEGPAGTPPPGVMPLVDNPPNLNVLVITTLVLCMVFSTLAVLMRTYTKAFLIKALDYEDYAVVLAWIGQVGQAIPATIMINHGSGYHIWDVRLKMYFRLFYWVDVATIVYGPVIFLVKLSILLQYLRIFCPQRQSNMCLYIGVHICIWISFVFYSLDTGFETFLCSPRERLWNPLTVVGHCFSVTALWKSSGVFNFASNFAILLLPIPSVWRLQVPLRKKLGILGIFSTGFLACAASIVRTYYSWILSENSDLTYTICEFSLWAWAEISIGIIASCMPVSPRFFQFVRFKVFRISSDKSLPRARAPSRADLLYERTAIRISDLESEEGCIRVDRTTEIVIGPSADYINSETSAQDYRKWGW